MLNDGGKIPIPSHHPFSKKTIMDDLWLFLNNDFITDVPTSMSVSQAPVTARALGNTIVWPKLGHGNKTRIPWVTHSLAMKVRAQEAMKAVHIQIRPPKITTIQGLPEIVFRSMDWKVKLS